MKSLTNILMASAILIITLQPLNSSAQTLDTLAQTPPMGWNSWNHFGCDVDAELIKETADAMVESGMKEAGYEFVNIDDCWQGERNEDGELQPDPERFPNGMKEVADYVHSKGLKLGIYSDAGDETCAGYPASRGHEYQDARTFAEWGIDYLKYDWCNTEGLNARGAYMTMRNALEEAGRPIVFSICEWGNSQPWEWAQDIGHLWRTTGDIIDCWDCELSHGSWSSWGILRILDMQKGLRQYAGPGHWNDPDMMEVGNDLSVSESRAHFSMWSMLSAPLIAGNDLRSMEEETREILTNEEVIAVNQDTLGIQGFRYKDIRDIEIWFKPLAGGDWAMCILNRGLEKRTISFDWKNEYVGDDLSGHSTQFGENTYTLRDLWKHEEIGTTEEPLKAEIPKHDVLMLKLNKQ